MNSIEKIQAWFLRHVNEDWEHGDGIQLRSLDNPGWHLRVALLDTDLEHKQFDPVVRRGESDWIDCKVGDGYFNGYGGPANLEELLRRFLDWAEG